MSVFGWIKNAGRYLGRKTIGAAKVIGRSVGKVARGVGNAIGSTLNAIESVPVLGTAFSFTPVAKAGRLVGGSLRGSGKLLEGDVKGALGEAGGVAKTIALGKAGKFGGKLLSSVIK